MNDDISDNLRAACARLAANAPRLTPEQIAALSDLFRSVRRAEREDSR